MVQGLEVYIENGPLIFGPSTGTMIMMPKAVVTTNVTSGFIQYSSNISGNKAFAHQVLISFGTSSTYVWLTTTWDAPNARLYWTAPSAYNSVHEIWLFAMVS